MKRLISGIIPALLLTFSFAASAQKQDSAQIKLLSDIVAKINELDVITSADNELVSQKMIYNPQNGFTYILNEGFASVDLLDPGRADSSGGPLRIDMSVYGGKPYAMAYGSGVLGVLLDADKAVDKLVCLGADGKYLRTFELDSALQGIYYNAYREQFLAYSFGRTGYDIFTIHIRGGASYLASAKVEHISFRIDDYQETAAEKMAKADPYGLEMMMVAMTVVFSALILLYLTFKYIAKLYTMDLRKRFLKKKKGEMKSEELPGIHDTTGELGAAIGLALYYYKNELHDHENTVLTIIKAAKVYSPWSSKIYSIRKPLK